MAWRNAKCKMQSAKCKMSRRGATAIQLWSEVRGESAPVDQDAGHHGGCNRVRLALARCAGSEQRRLYGLPLGQHAGPGVRGRQEGFDVRRWVCPEIVRARTAELRGLPSG